MEKSRLKSSTTERPSIWLGAIAKGAGNAAVLWRAQCPVLGAHLDGFLETDLLAAHSADGGWHLVNFASKSFQLVAGTLRSGWLPRSTVPPTFWRSMAERPMVPFM